MNSFTRNKFFRLFIALLLLTGSMAADNSAQTTNPKPLLQPIIIQSSNSTPNPSPSATPLVTKTASSLPVKSVSTAYPVLADVEIPGYTGILVETPEGKQVMESYSNLAFNPASNVKLATAYAVLKTFGPNFRFRTDVYYDGQIDKTTGTLYGNLYVSGRDPAFNLEHGVAIAHELNRSGIQTVTGDLIVTDNFVMNFSSTAKHSGTVLDASLNSAKRTAAINRAWQNYLLNSNKVNQVQTVPSVSLAGGVYVQSLPTNARLLFSHESAPMREILKATLCFSNNFLAEKLGDMLGGAYAVARIVQQNSGVQPTEFYLATSSGLGINRVTPRAMMRLLRTLQSELAKNRMTFADIMPVAGMDKGTLEDRFDTDFSRGSVVGKTGTMNNTDAGVSSLAGEISTRGGKLLFVIFNNRGSVPRFRNFQNSLVSLIQGQFGGAAPINYNPVSLDLRMANTRITYPDMRGSSGLN
jgi:serine-type D-Ala-D-Ala carboxypeptidase/endopeptidase (penicillin-binding protein 4)